MAYDLCVISDRNPIVHETRAIANAITILSFKVIKKLFKELCFFFDRLRLMSLFTRNWWTYTVSRRQIHIANVTLLLSRP